MPQIVDNRQLFASKALGRTSLLAKYCGFRVDPAYFGVNQISLMVVKPKK